MIIGGYDLHLYCDYPDEDYEHRGSAAHPGPSHVQIMEPSKRAAYAEARKRGWAFRMNKCLCPYCKRRKRSLANSIY